MSEQFPETNITKVFSQVSRYKDTDIYKDTDGNFYFGIWTIPKIEKQPEDTYHIVKHGEELRLDSLAAKYYGNKLLWWIIAVANNIVDPFTEIVFNTTIRIPNLNYIYSVVLT